MKNFAKQHLILLTQKQIAKMFTIYDYYLLNSPRSSSPNSSSE